MSTLFPPIEPYEQGTLRCAVEPDCTGEPDGTGEPNCTGAPHAVYFELCGNRDGVPALFLHGGPGSSSNPGHRRFFDPSFYRVVLFDQRGCGRSTPRGAVEHNSTQHLIADIEQLRETLGVARWLLFGGSWGSTLALAYAQAHPQRVCAMVLRGLFLASAEEIAWFVRGLRRFLPEAWDRFAAGAAEASADAILRHYAAQVSGPDAAAARAAARSWSAYENAAMAVGEATSFCVSSSAAPAALTGAPSAAEDSALLDRVRVQLHYLRNACFLEPGQLLRGMPALAGIRAILVQGRRDLVCPPATAYTVQRAWPNAQLRMVEEGGHSALHPAVAAALVQATQDAKGMCGA